MTANRSLDEFAPGEPDAPEPAEDPADAAVEPGPPDAAEADEDADEPVPPTVTYVWSPEGGPCSGCGETASARWRDGDDLVCADCKAW